MVFTAFLAPIIFSWSTPHSCDVGVGGLRNGLLTGCDGKKISEVRTMKTNFLLCLALLSGAAVTNGQNMPSSGIPHEVLAFYYPWYDMSRSGKHNLHWGIVDAAAHETDATAHYPARGVYNSMDPDVVRSHIELAKSNGITGFIVSWWGHQSKETRNDASVPLILQSANQEHFKISVYWEQEEGPTAGRTSNAVDDLVYLVTQFGTNDAFLKVGGKPVIFVYGRVLSQIHKDWWPGILRAARAKAGPFLLIADKYEEANAQLFDGLHQYNISPAGAKFRALPELHAWAAQYNGDCVKLARQYHRISCATVIPGYNDTKIRKPGRNVDRQDGGVYRTLWEAVINAHPDWVVITSWNEWLEGTEIEPSVEYGDQYLKLTAEYSGRFMGTKP